MLRLAVTMLGAFIALSVPIMNAHNWGAGDSKQTLGIFCTGEISNKSECTPFDRKSVLF